MFISYASDYGERELMREPLSIRAHTQPRVDGDGSTQILRTAQVRRQSDLCRMECGAERFYSDVSNPSTQREVCRGSLSFDFDHASCARHFTQRQWKITSK